jgi:ElaA protein
VNHSLVIPLQWVCKKFDALTLHELYAILQLRIEVFIVEQNCPFQDADSKDMDCYHLMCWEDGMLLAYSRLVPAGISFAEISIGRVVSSVKARGRGLGKELMQRSLSTAFTLFGKQPLRIGAQLYLKRFYESLGFLQDGPVYLEDGIEHIEMLLHE